jgi:hypothetical protein
MISTVWFWWRASRGYRLMPWRSPYLRWRVETYSGKQASRLTFSDFWELFRTERKQVGTYLGWVAEMRELAKERKRS